MNTDELQEICTEQKLTLEKQDTGLPRDILPELPEIKSHALVINGIRRCGKSTLLRQFIKKLNRNFFYFNFDDIRLASFTISDYKRLDNFIKEGGFELLFFDEIQSAPKWELYIRQKLDEGFQIIITGSNASLLSRELGTHLTGRHISRELFPFSYDEFCCFFSLNKGHESFIEYLNKGGFPEFLKKGNTESLHQLQSDILYRDIVARYRIRDASSLRRLFVYLVSNTAQLFSPSNLTNISGVKSPTTVLEYISYFESAYLIYLLPCFSYSLKSQNLAPKKVYIADPGIIKTSSASFSNNNGAQLENYIFCHLRSKTGIPNFPKDRDIFYFRGKKSGECDFIFSPNTKPVCIQVCWELTDDNKEREIDGLVEALEFFNQITGYIITYNTEDIHYIDDKIIKVIPGWKFRFTE